MKTYSKPLSLCAILAAASTVIVCIASLFPSGRVAFAAIAGLSGVIAMIRCGGKWAAGIYVVSAILCLLLSPDKGNALMFTAFFGYYPALKSLLERVRNRYVGWILKFAIFNAALILLYFLLRLLFLDGFDIRLPLWLALIGANVVFVLYDIGLSRLIQVYIRNIVGKI